MGASGLWNRSIVAAMLDLQHRLHTAAVDEIARRRMWIDGMCRIVAAPIGVLVVHEIDGTVPGGLASADTAGTDAEISQRLARALLGADQPDPAAVKLVKKVGRREKDGIITCTRAELIDDDQWYGHSHVRTVREPMGLDDTVYSARKLDDRLIACLALFRPWNHRQAFRSSERDVVDLLHAQCDWVYRDDAPPASLEALALSRREKQTLLKLLDGRSEKQIAREMRLSPNTVHHYVKSIYRRLGVSSRGELSAKWLARIKRDG
jgi:DNA-binding CsgD family transcriptional regulator